MGVEDVVLDQVVDHVERQCELSALAGVVPEQGKALRRVAVKALATQRDSALADVEAQVPRVARKCQLVAVAAAELDHRLNTMLGDELVQDCGLELGVLAIRAGARIAAHLVAALPVGLRTGRLRHAGDVDAPQAA